MSLKDPLSRFTGRKNSPPMRQSGPPEPCLGGIPDLIEPLLGWRAWRVWTPPPGSDRSPTFSSVILDTPWTPRRKISAEHSFDLGERCRGLLKSDCSCGVYSFADPAEAFGYLVTVRDRLLGMSVEVALGTVSLWGKVIVCERGYKAQYAYPHHLYLPASLSRFVPTISSVFGVGVGIYASTCEEEISLGVPSSDGGKPWPLRLKNSGLLGSGKLPYAVGFYDLAASPAPMSQLPRMRSSPSSPVSGSDEPSGGASRP